MKLISLFILVSSLLGLSHAALYHQCFPFSRSVTRDGQDPKDIASSLNIRVGRLTSVLIYNLLDIEVTNIPLKLDDEYIKRYINGFTICGLQDVESGYCTKEQFGQFTVVQTDSEKQIKHGLVNKFVQTGSLLFAVPYSGVWCALLYQDGAYFEDCKVTPVQEFGYLSVLEYNEYSALGLVCLFELTVFVIWSLKFLKYRGDKVKNNSTLFKEFWKLTFIEALTHLLLRLFLEIKNNDVESNSSLEFFLLILIASLRIVLFLTIFDVVSGNSFKSFNNSESNLPKAFFRFLHNKKLFITLLITRAITEVLLRFLTIDGLDQIFKGIPMVQNILIWIIIYKISLHTMDYLFNSDELTGFKRTRYITFIVPLVFNLIKLMSLTIYDKSHNNLTNKTSFVVKYLDNTIFYSIFSNLNLFSFGWVLLTMLFIWEKRLSNQKV